MRLNPTAVAIATALAIAIIWTVCSILVALLPGVMTDMAEHMIHANLQGFSWTLTLPGYVIGLIAWSAWAAVTGWLIAAIYNWVAQTRQRVQPAETVTTPGRR